MINRIAGQNGVSPNLVKGLIKAESGFDPEAVSSNGACGLMQLMPQTAKTLGVKDIFDPLQNVRAGVKYLSDLIERFGDVRAALAAYVVGPGVVLRSGVPTDAATLSHIDRILRYSRAFRR
jgi:soluble lytic murein transglycosylase-like protein